MKSKNNKKSMLPMFGQFLALWVFFMLLIVLYSKWADTQPEFYQDGGFWRDFAFSQLGYKGIAIAGAVDAILFFPIWLVCLSVYRRCAKLTHRGLQHFRVHRPAAVSASGNPRPTGAPHESH